MNQDTEKLLLLVAEKTGYRVSVSGGTGMTSYARMTTASRSMPMHIIEVNEQYHKHGDYIVAVQCAMILVKWADPDRIPSFIVRTEKREYLVDKYMQQVVFPGMPDQARKQYAQMIVDGLLNQLQSQPVEMMAIAYCRQNCPSLIELQNETVVATLREATASLAPRIKSSTPAEVFEKSATMNTAFAINWARLTGSEMAVLPYKSMGLYDKGYDLFKIFEAIPSDDPCRYVKNVDGWAQMLNLSSYYEWQYRKAE